MRRCIHYAWLALLLLTSASTQANESQVIFSFADTYATDHVAVFTTDNHQATLAQVVEKDAFTATDELHYGYTNAVVWLRIPVINGSAFSANWLLRFDNPYIDRIDVYVQRGALFSEQRSGQQVAIGERPGRYRQLAFPFVLDAQESVTLYVRAESSGSLTLTHQLITDAAFEQSNSQQLFWLALYFGMLLALGLYNLLLFAGVREPVFLFYSLFVVTFGSATLAVNGFGTLFFWDPELINTNRVMSVGYILSALMGTLFARAFLNIASYSKRWNSVLILFAILQLGAAAVALFAPLPLSQQIADVAGGFLTAIVLLSAGIYGMYRRAPMAGLFVLAWSFLLIGAFSFSLRNLGILPSNFLTIYGIQMGSAVEMLLLSFALAARFNQLKKQKEAAQSELVQRLRLQEAELEAKVEERTLELERLATSDMLTGLLNRNGLNKCLREAIERARRNKQTITLFMLDLDEFKPINDEYGHDCGDLVLQTIAARISESARGVDGIARFGGDEFIIVAENFSEIDAIEGFIARLHTAIRRPILLPSGVEVSVGASIGYCTAHPPMDINALLREADKAMYAVKKQR